MLGVGLVEGDLCVRDQTGTDWCCCDNTATPLHFHAQGIPARSSLPALKQDLGRLSAAAGRTYTALSQDNRRPETVPHMVNLAPVFGDVGAGNQPPVAPVRFLSYCLAGRV